jgi:uncharacterized membrane protein YadS
VLLCFPAWAINSFVERNQIILPFAVFASILIAILMHVRSGGRITAESEEFHAKLLADPQLQRGARAKRVLAASLAITTPLFLAIAYFAEKTFDIAPDVACLVAGGSSIAISCLAANYSIHKNRK